MNILVTAEFEVVCPRASTLPGVSWFKDKHGKVRWRYRKADMTVPLGTEYGGQEFMRRYRNACEGISLAASPQEGRAGAISKNSLSALIGGWYHSPHFTGLSKSTRAGYRRIAENIRLRHGHHSVKTMRVQDVIGIIQEKADWPNSANADRRVLCFVLDHAVDLELVDVNAARQTEKLPISSKGLHTWTEEEIEKFLAFHAYGSLARSVMMLMIYTGASRRDVVTFGPSNITEDRFRYLRCKTAGREAIQVDIPIHPPLQECINSCIATAPDYQTFLQTDHGKQRSSAGFGSLIRKWCDEAGLRQCTAHGLRKACARRLKEAGVIEQELASVLGYADATNAHAIIGMGDRTTLADRAIGKSAQ